MLIRLGGLSLPAMEMGCRDLSLLTPEEQDRVWELFRKVATHFKALNWASPSKRFQSYIGLLAKVPTLGPGEKFAGPKIEVPRALKRYWDWVKPAMPGTGRHRGAEFDVMMAAAEMADYRLSNEAMARRIQRIRQNSPQDTRQDIHSA